MMSTKAKKLTASTAASKNKTRATEVATKNKKTKLTVNNSKNETDNSNIVDDSISNNVKSTCSEESVEFDEQQTRKAVLALLAYHAQKSRFVESIQLVLCLKSIPDPFIPCKKIPLPYPNISPESEKTKVCLFTQEDRKSVKKTLSDAGITSINQVIDLAKLKSHFQTFALKRALCNQYDVFLSDLVVFRSLPKLLGKSFYAQKKLPIMVSLKSKHLSRDIERSIKCTLLYFQPDSTKTCIRIGNTGMDSEQLVHNIIHAIKVITGKNILNGFDTIKALHLKTPESIALPLYLA